MKNPLKALKMTVFRVITRAVKALFKLNVLLCLVCQK